VALESGEASTCTDDVFRAEQSRLEEIRSLQSGANPGNDLENGGTVSHESVRANTGEGSRLVSNMSDAIDDPERIGNKLRAAREARGLNQIELAAATGYSNGWISSIERGVAIPTATFIRRMEVALGADLGSAEYALPRGRRGDVGDWGMTITEVAGYVGLSRTRVYELAKNYSRLRDSSGRAWATDTQMSEIYKSRLPWVDVDGYQRVAISDCAKWRVYDSMDVVKPLDEIDALVEKEIEEIKKWLKKRRRA
jgi:ribosome-binding protein aMBF1 (putative translation factor)